MVLLNNPMNYNDFSITEGVMVTIIVFVTITEVLIYRTKRKVFTFDVEQPVTNQYNNSQSNKHLKTALSLALFMLVFVATVGGLWGRVPVPSAVLKLIINYFLLVVGSAVLFPIFLVIENPDILQFYRS